MYAARAALAALWVAAAGGLGCTSPPPQPSPAEVPRLTFTLPGTWIREQPTSSMRALQARVPGSAGDARFTVFYFGEGKGGDVGENIQRWIDQIDFQEKSSTHREEFSSNGLTVYWVDFSGTLKPDPMAGGSREPLPNSRLLGAVVEGPGGPWFFKLVGPDTSVAAQRDAFVRMLESARPRE